MHTFIVVFSGELYITGGLDREAEDVYRLNVSVTDGGVDPSPLETFTMATIMIDDYNDNPPSFGDGDLIKFTVSEEMNPPVLVGTVIVTDPDEGVNGEVVCEIVDSGKLINQQCLFLCTDLFALSLSLSMCVCVCVCVCDKYFSIWCHFFQYLL